MSKTKTPAISAQLKNALAEIEALKKKIENTESISRYRDQENTKLSAELGQIHAFLDAVPNPPVRETETGNYGAKVAHSAMTRLSVYLATRSA